MSIPIFNIFTLTVLVFSLHPCYSVKTLVVDGLAEQQVTTILVEGSLVFEHLPNLYLFHSRRAFDICNFSEARLIFDGSSSSNNTQFTWHAPRPGHYYFSTRDGSQCEKGEKVPVRVIIPDISSPAASPHAAPPPAAGGFLPAFPSPGTPSSSPSMAPDTAPLVPRDAPAGPSPRSAPSGEGIPFISSNPAVPLPTGETDTATIRPLPTPGDENNQVVGLGSSVGVGVAAMVVSVMVSSAMGLWL